MSDAGHAQVRGRHSRDARRRRRGEEERERLPGQSGKLRRRFDVGGGGGQAAVVALHPLPLQHDAAVAGRALAHGRPGTGRQFNI